MNSVLKHRLQLDVSLVLILDLQNPEENFSRAHIPPCTPQIAHSTANNNNNVTLSVYNSTTLTYIALEYVQWTRHKALLGVVDRHG